MLGVGPSTAELLQALVGVQRLYLTEPDPGRAFQRVLALMARISGSGEAFLTSMSPRDEASTEPQVIAAISAEGANGADRLQPAEAGRDIAHLDWASLCEAMLCRGHAKIPAHSATGDSGLWWALPCCDQQGIILGVVGLSDIPATEDDEHWTMLRSSCDLCGAMLEGDQLARSRTQQAREQGEARYRSFADHTTDGLFIHDMDGQLIDVNLRACESLGYTREELIGQTPLLFDPDVTADRMASYMTRLKNGESLFFESRHRRKDGTEFPVEIRVSPFVDNGQTYALSLACDITARKYVEEQLRESEAKFRALAMNAPVAIFIKDSEGRYTVANPLTCEALGKPDGVVGLTDYDLLPQEVADKFRRDDLEVLATGKQIQFDDLVERDGYAHHFITAKFPLLDTDGKPTAVCGLAIDVTEREQAEQALRESEERFRALVAMTSQIVWTVGADGQVKDPVPSWESFTGQTHQESVNEGWVNMIHPEDREPALERWHQCSSTGEKFEFEYRLWHAPTQTWRWTQVSGVCLRNPDGAIRSWVGMHNDITERKEAADALQLSEARYRNFVDHATDGLFLHDDEGRVVDVNRQACSSLGYQRDELIGMTPYEFDLDLTPALAADMNARLSSGETVAVDSRHRRKDGSIFPVEIRIRPFWVEGRRYAISLVQDITERKRAERSLRLTQFSVDHSAIAVFWVSRDSTIHYVNDMACQSLGYSRDELVGMSVADITDHTPDSWQERFAQIKERRSVTFESHHKRSDGTQFPVEVTVHYDEFDGDQFLFAFAHDITERKEAELKFEQQAAELLHASRLSTVGEMVAALSHEVAQPLSAIGNFAAACEKILSSRSNTRRAELREYIEAILKQNRRCAAILQRLRDYSKRTSDCRGACDLAHLLRESVELVSSDLRSHGVEVRFDLPDEVPPVVVDRVQIQQVIVNLLTNARDAVLDEADDRRVITIRASAEPDCASFFVEDLGNGFAAADAHRLFEPFFTTKENGMGIGLSICHSIVYDHGGTIQALTNDAGGATFAVRLPWPRSPGT